MTVAVGQQMKADDLLKLTFFPVGTILMFSGNWTNGTGGWYICDGKNGTPNLVGKFIKGGASSGVDGGNVSYSFTITDDNLPSHTHTDSGHTHRHSHTTHTGSWGQDDGEWSKGGSVGNSLSTSRIDYDSSSGGGYGVKVTLSATHSTDATTGKASLSSAYSDSPTQITIPTEPEFYTLVYIMKVTDPSKL